MSPDSVIYVIDDDRPVLESLAFLLAAAGYRVETFQSALAFFETKLVSPACVLTDVRMPEMDGLELLRRLGERIERPPVIVMTGHGDIPLAVEAMRSGAFDFLEKPFDDEVLLRSLEQALTAANDRGPAMGPDPALQGKIDRLTARELETMRLLVRGKPNKIIAFELGISPRTVEVHRANLMTKMEASSFSELVRMGLAAGIEQI